MADLFDMKVGGLGFHITAHMIAIAALFVACFAITGYISFRDNSIGSDAIEDNVTYTDLVVNDTLTQDGFVTKVFKTTYPARVAADAGDSLGPIVQGITQEMGCYFVSAYVEQSSAQTAALGALIIETGTNAECAYDSAANATILTGTLHTSVANTAGRGGQGQLSNLVDLGAATDTAICLTAATSGAVVAGAVTVYVTLAHGPGGSFPTELPNSA